MSTVAQRIRTDELQYILTIQKESVLQTEALDYQRKIQRET